VDKTADKSTSLWVPLRDVLEHVEFEVVQPYVGDGRIPARHLGIFSQLEGEPRSGPGGFRLEWLAGGWINTRGDLAFLRSTARWHDPFSWEPPAEEIVWAFGTELDGVALTRFLPEVMATICARAIDGRDDPAPAPAGASPAGAVSSGSPLTEPSQSPQSPQDESVSPGAETGQEESPSPGKQPDAPTEKRIRPRGPKPGTVKRYASADRKLSESAAGGKPAAAPHPRGRKPAGNWKIVDAEVFRLMDYHGEFSDDDPEWNAQARLEAAIADFCQKKFNKPPSEATIRAHVCQFLKRWRQSRSET
jgi:hypothetical protein